MIYFISNQSGFVKIGYTSKNDARQRLSGMQTSSPYELVLLGTIRDDRAINAILRTYQFKDAITFCGGPPVTKAQFMDFMEKLEQEERSAREKEPKAELD